MTSTALKYVMINLTDSKVGSGYRHFVVVSEGRKWVKLLYAPSLTLIKITVAEFNRYATVTKLPISRIKKMLIKSRKYHKAYGMSYPKKVVKDILSRCVTKTVLNEQPQDLLNL